MTLNNIRAILHRWWDIQVTIRELSHLDNKELDDLGIGRWQIEKIAQRTAR